MSWWKWWRHDDDNLTGGPGRDWLFGGWGNDTIDGGGGNDLIWSGRGNDVIYGGDGNDLAFGGSGNDTIDGGNGNDRLWGGWGDDTIDGGNGNDRLWGGWGDDDIQGGAGRDKIKGGWGDDTIDGGEGNDRLWGGRGDDEIQGGAGRDKIKGGSGEDTVDGGAGSDKVDAGSSDDVGVYNVTENVGSKDKYDGGSGNDHLVFKMTSDEYTPEVQADLARFQAFLDGGGHGWGHHKHSFKFEAFDLKVKNWESFEVMLTDTGSNEPPVANDDTIFANLGTVGTIADSDQDAMSSNDSVASAQVIERSSFRIEPTLDVGDDTLPRVSIDGQITPNTDVDIFAIDLVAGETLVLDIDYGMQGAAVDTQLFILNANGDEVVSNDTAEMNTLGGAGSPGFPGFADAYLTYTVTADGTYYFAVSASNNGPPFDGTNGTGNSSGDYVLNVSVEGAAPDLGGVTILADALLANDTDADGDALSIIGVSNVMNGEAFVNEDGDVVFTPASGAGSGSFDYTINDGTTGHDSTATATVVTVNGGEAVAGGASDDILIGSDGNDAFAFAAGSGDDIITDFTLDSDFLLLADGTSATFQQVDNDTLVTFDTGGEVLLVGVTGVDDIDQLLG